MMFPGFYGCLIHHAQTLPSVAVGKEGYYEWFK
jgi:hypothetical protein